MFVLSGSPEKERLRATVREFAAAHVEPVALEHDAARTAPLELLEKFTDLGLTARWFGSADDCDSFVAETCIATEELAYACAATATLLMLPILFNRIVLRELAEPARSAFRDQLLGEPVVTSFAATERTAGSDLRSVQTRARRVDGGYVIDGRKEYSSNVRHAAYVIVVAGTGDDGKRDARGLSWFLVPTDAPGVEIGERWPTLGLHALDVSPVNLAGVCVPAEHRLGEEGRGFAMMGSSLAHSRTGIAAVGVGIARRARDEVIAFGSRRVLYGEKLHKQQDFRFRIAEIEKDIAAAQALVGVSALKQDQGLDATKEASIAKAFAGQMVMRVTDLASQMLGSIGYTGQSIVDKLYRDARHVAIVEGSEATHKEIIFASVLRRGGY